MALAGLTLAALTGCTDLANSRLDFDTTEKVAVTEIRISGGAGDVTIRGGGTAGQVTIARVVRYRGDEPGRTYRLNGTALNIETDCGNMCRVSYEIEAPEGVVVRGENGSGDVRLTDVAEVDVKAGSGGITVNDSSGDVTVDTGSGDIRVRSVAGALNASAGSGSIEATDISGGTARVKTGSGDVTLALDRPADVRGEVGSGDLTVTVPAGRYQVQTSTGSGEANVGVTQDPTADHLLDLDSGSGDITVSTA
jgi:hypothetical protein